MRCFTSPSANYLGADALSAAMSAIGQLGARRALLVTDRQMITAGVAERVEWTFRAQGIQALQFECGVPRPTVETVERGLLALKSRGCDMVVSLGGDAVHDCAKGISLCATNGGRISDYEGVDVSLRQGLPVVCINVSGGAGSFVTRFCLIKQLRRPVPMAVVDRHLAPWISIGDPLLMLELNPATTAAMGMDTFSHAVEACMSTGATPMTDACAIKAIELVSDNLARAVFQGQDLAAREALAYAHALAGMAQGNAYLGYTNAIARQLAGIHEVSTGVGNALVLPHLQWFNALGCPERLARIAHAMRLPSHGKSPDELAQMACAAMAQLARTVDIPMGLEVLGISHLDIPMLARNALQDPCGVTSPRYASQADIEEVLRRAM